MWKWNMYTIKFRDLVLDSKQIYLITAYTVWKMNGKKTTLGWNQYVFVSEFKTGLFITLCA